ncbi:MAG: aminoglycoside phosphotransferase family protein [Rhodospirillaceae bacterium]
MNDPKGKSYVQALVRQADHGQVESIHRIFGGRNNQVFKVETSTNKTYALKFYVSHPQDTRDRLGAEYAFCQYAWTQGLQCTPEPVAADPINRLGLFSWVDGAVPKHVDRASITQVLSFLEGLEGGRSEDATVTLPMASEACLTTIDHVETVERRLAVLISGLDDDPLDQEVAVLLNEVSGVWKEVREKVLIAAEEIDVKHPIQRSNQCISPSDLGFHNALINENGKLTFLDFEYAGWDDPAKLVCDFFHQERIPIPKAYYVDFRDAIIGSHACPEQEAYRIDMLMPVYAVKWLTMRLNEFRPEGAHRRAFAHPDQDPMERKASQLDKARKAFQVFQSDLGNL